MRYPVYNLKHEKTNIHSGSAALDISHIHLLTPTEAPTATAASFLMVATDADIITSSSENQPVRSRNGKVQNTLIEDSDDKTETEENGMDAVALVASSLRNQDRSTDEVKRKGRASA